VAVPRGIEPRFDG